MAKKASKKTTRKSAAPKKAVAANRKSAKKVSARKPAVTKSAARKKAVGKSPKKAPARKAPKKAAPAKKSTSKKKAVKKSVKKTTKKTTKKTAAPKKAVKKSAAKKPAAKKKTEAKKSAVKKTASPKKTAVKKKTAAPKKAAKKSAASKAVEKVLPKALKEKKFLPDIARPTGMYNGVRLLEESEIEPFPKKTPYTKKELVKLEQALEEERDNLLRELASLQTTSQQALESARENPGHSLHLAEHATDLQTAETNLAVRSYEVERLAQIEEALDRIKNNINHYGLCLASGRKIGIKRLIAQPHAHLCKEMQERYEQIRRRRGF